MNCLVKKSLGTVAAVLCGVCSAGEATYSFSWYAGPTVSGFSAPMALREGVDGFSYAGFATGDGSDLRVRDAGGNLLPYEIEHWDPEGYSLVWVNLPSLSSTATVSLSWGDATAEQSPVANIWPEAYHVFHFGDSPTRDSSPNNLPMTQGVCDRVGAPEGQGMSFSGDRGKGTKRLGPNNIPSSAFASGSLPATFTFSFWMKVDSFDTKNSYLWYLNGNGQVAVIFNFNSKVVELYNGGGLTGEDPRNQSAITVPDLRWHHYAYTYDGTTFRNYFDGEKVGERKLSFGFTSWSNKGPLLYVGSSSGTANNFDGSLDEVRFESVARSADWIKACYSTPAQVHDYDDVCELEFPEYDGDSTLTDFPLMVTLDDRLPGLTDTMRSAMRDPRSIHFFTDDGLTELDYEPECAPVDSGTTATYWLNVPSFAKGAKIRLQTTPFPWPVRSHSFDASHAGEIWRSGFQHVWHLASTLYRYDSASGGKIDFSTTFYWTNYAAAVSGPSGRYCAMQCGPNISVISSSGTDAQVLSNRYTISFWARKDAADFAVPHASYVFQIRNGSTSRQIAVLTGFRAGKLNTFHLWTSDQDDCKMYLPIPDPEWHHYAFVSDGVVMHGYRDGIEVASLGSAYDLKLASSKDRVVSMGTQRQAPTSEAFSGALDEFRIETEPRSADWIAACAHTQCAQRDGVARLTLPAFGSACDVRALNGGLKFSADLICRVSSSIKFYYGPSDGGSDSSAWAGSIDLGKLGDGKVESFLPGSSPNACVCGRFCARNEWGTAWSGPLTGYSSVIQARSIAVATVNNWTGDEQLDFPLCLKLPSSLGLPESPAAVRFLENGGSPLPYEIEKWDASDESVAWVRVPKLVNRLKVRVVSVAESAAGEDGLSSGVVWNSGYQAVYHLASATDSSLHGRSFQPGAGAASSGVVGPVGPAMAFAGSSEELKTLKADDLMAALSGAFTISGWIKAGSTQQNAYVLQVHNGAFHFALLYGWNGDLAPRTLSMYVSDNPSAYIAGNSTSDQIADLRYTVSPIVLPDDAWHHFVYTTDQTKMAVYLDGELIRILPRSYSLGSGQPTRQRVDVGLGQTSGGGSQFAGQLDELRFESVVRSSDWVKACYLNQSGALLRMRPDEGVVLLLR